jgi:hypothetical protein
VRGLCQLEVDLLIDASTNVGPERVTWSPRVNLLIERLYARRLIRYVNDPDGCIRGVITPLGRLVLSVALTEPSLVSP